MVTNPKVIASSWFPLAFGQAPSCLAMTSQALIASGGEPDDMSNLLVAVAEERDRKAFVSLFEHFAPRIKGYLRRQGASDGEAEDLMQDVMLTVWTRAPLFDRRKARASTWIFTIARNKRIDAIRRERRPELDPNDPALVPDRNDNPDDAASAAEWRVLVRRAIENVPPEQARVLRLAFFDDMSHAAIAKELNLPVGTVKSRMRLAFAKLRSSLEELR